MRAENRSGWHITPLSEMVLPHMEIACFLRVWRRVTLAHGFVQPIIPPGLAHKAAPGPWLERWASLPPVRFRLKTIPIWVPS